MSERLRICFVGCGHFARNFIPLFKAHPAVESLSVCDLQSDLAQSFGREYGAWKVFTDFNEVLKDSHINAVALFTQRHQHAPLAIQALKADKHVYSSVPTGTRVEEIQEIESLVRERRLLFSCGETGVYRPAAIFCRKKILSGEMRNFVSAEAQYNHDLRHCCGGLRPEGENRWKMLCTYPPLLYPTHSTSMILSCLPGVHAVKVVGFGYRDKQEPWLFGEKGENMWNNPFSNGTMLMQLSNGGTARISENRRVGWYAPQTYISNFLTETASYEFSVLHHYYAHWDKDEPSRIVMEDVSPLLNPPEVQSRMGEEEGLRQELANGLGFRMTSPIQPLERLPKELAPFPNGHNGTHKFMTDDFCRAFSTGKLPPTNIWASARFNLPGIVAQQSALKDGETLTVPDLGNPPDDWEQLPF